MSQPDPGPPTGHDPVAGYGSPSGQTSGHGQPAGYGPPPGYGPGGPRPVGSDARIPGVGAAAGVLGFVEGGLGLVFLVYVLATTSAFGFGDQAGWFALFSLLTVGISALLLLGSLFLVRGSGRRLLLGTTIAEIVLVAGLGIWAVAESSSSYLTPPGYYDDSLDAAISGTVLGAAVVALVLPVVRLVLGAQRAVGSWLQATAGARRAAPPVWSPEANAWVAARTSSPGPVLALMAPVAAVAVAVVVVLLTAPDEFDYVDAVPYVDPGGASPYSELYDGGNPVTPPTSDDVEYDAGDAPNAAACFGGDLDACDDLYFESEISSLYEWLGSTCGGRQEFETYGNCA